MYELQEEKMRCDGQWHCGPCGVSNLCMCSLIRSDESHSLTTTACSYDNGGRITSTEYIQSLERKLGRLEEVLSSSFASQSQSQTHRTEDSESPPSGLGEGEVRQDDMIETIVGADERHLNGTASDRNENATQEPINLARDPGDYGGLSLLRRVHKLCKHVSGMKLDGDNDLPNDDLSASFEVAPPDTDLSISWETFALLPSRESVTKAIDIVVDEATCNMHFLTRANLQQIADEVFDDMETESTAHARRPLALIYAVVALSRRFHPIEQRAKGAKQTTTLNGCVARLRM